MKIIALDPGETTGYAIYSSYKTKSGQVRSLVATEIGPDPHHLQLYSLLDNAHPNVVVCEDFRYQRGPGGHNLTPVEYIGICKLWSTKNHVPLELQGRTYKVLWDDGKIKQLGLWRPGKPHAMDALRHLLYYVTLILQDSHYVKQLEP